MKNTKKRRGKHRKITRNHKNSSKINHKKKFSKQFTKKMCSAGRKGFSCYSKKSLEYLKNKWNKKNPNNKITTNKQVNIWSKLRNKMSNKCSDEKCWLKQDFIKNNLTNELKNYTFSPDAPDKWYTNKNQWLTSTDILKVMKQYEYEYKNFTFIGPSPIDFDTKKEYNMCVWDDLCNFNLEKLLSNNKKMIGFIFNLDPHYKSGSHWVSMFLNIDQEFLFYNDSTGSSPPKQIKILVKRILDQSKKLGLNIKYTINKIQHQKKKY